MGEVVRRHDADLSRPFVGVASAKDEIATQEAAPVELLAHIALKLRTLDIGVGIFELPPGGAAGVANTQVGHARSKLVLVTEGKGVGELRLEAPQERPAHGGLSHTRPRCLPWTRPTGGARWSRGFGC